MHRRLLDGSPRMTTLNATSPNDSSQIVDVSLSASMNGENSSLLPMPSGTSSLVLRRPSANMFVSRHSIFCFLRDFLLCFLFIIYTILLRNSFLTVFSSSVSLTIFFSYYFCLLCFLSSICLTFLFRKITFCCYLHAVFFNEIKPKIPIPNF